MNKTVRVSLCLLLAALTYGFGPDQEPLRGGLTLFVLAGSLWMTQALDLTVTALLVPLLASLGGLLTPKEALASFAHPVIFLFLGGFALAAALEHHGLDRALAVAVLRLARGHRRWAVGLLFLLTAAVSMWISNTATTALMLPLALGLLHRTGTAEPTPDNAREHTFVLLGVAYSASIGGIGTIVGSPPNAIAAAAAHITFVEWMKFGLPTVAILLPLMVLVLALVIRPKFGSRVEVPHEPFEWTRERLTTVAIFVLAIVGWVFGAPLFHAIGVTKDLDTIVALGAIVLLCLTGTMQWRAIEKGTQWGVLLLFGGGIALSHVMGSSGASRYLADQLLAMVSGAPMWLLLVAIVAFVVMLTELVSNTAASALLIPLFLGVAGALGLPPAMLAGGIAVAASCAFMLPVATPPNALVYGTGRIPAPTMMRCGLWLNVLCIVVLSLLMHLRL
ncbi:MAG: DASS family sodium-coupled anion symporter [Betaproteobacteria bacterium]|nr:DASS family sodium-coupled anion symporter [Betaproteobacteria bacterium]